MKKKGEIGKKEEEKEEADEVDDELISEFSEVLEKGINKVCGRINRGEKKVDPRFELFLTLGSFASQVAMDMEMGSEEFLEMMGDIYSDLEEEEEEVDKNSIN